MCDLVCNLLGKDVRSIWTHIVQIFQIQYLLSLGMDMYVQYVCICRLETTHLLQVIYSLRYYTIILNP